MGVCVCVRKPPVYPFLLSPEAAEFLIQPPGSGGPLRRQPAYASPHEAQGLFSGSHLLQQTANVGLENSLWMKEREEQCERRDTPIKIWCVKLKTSICVKP